MNITNEFQKIGAFVAKDGFIATLKKMPLFSIVSVEILGVTKLEPLHDSGQRDALHLHQRVDMVPHQRIGIQMKSIP